MSSSGLIYAVIVGAWAAYLVPMWLRRQDELNEARPTERFSTAIRLLSGRAAMERRYAKNLRERTEGTEEDELGSDLDAGTDASPDLGTGTGTGTGTGGAGIGSGPSPGPGSADARSFAMPSDAEDPESAPDARARPHAPAARPERAGPRSARPRPGDTAGPATGSAGRPATGSAGRPGTGPATGPGVGGPAGPGAAARARRSKVLARRRRTTLALFLAFTVGAVVAAVGGLTFLWAPAAPALLLSVYIGYLRAQERRRFTYTMDRRRAEAAAQRLRDRRPDGVAARRTPAEPSEHPEPEAALGLSALAADRRALVEQTDHAEWVDQQRDRDRGAGRGESWDPVPVPLPTYVTAPVAPRATGGVDLGAPDTWSSARSSAAEPAATDRARTPAPDAPAPADPGPDAAQTPPRRTAPARRSREHGRTPLFDQYAEGDRPRAANE
ncbi:divisome protein SepX/GlpR [Streptomyces sp. O3]